MTAAIGRFLQRLPDPARRQLVGFLRAPVRAGIRYLPWAPARRFLWYSVAKAYAWEPHRFRTRTTFGATMTGDSVDLLPQFVYYFGIWEPDATAWLERCLQPGDVFVDVGANVGYFTLLAARRVGPAGAVIAVEASPAIHGELAANVAANDTGNVRTVNVAAGRALGTTTVFDGPVHHRGLTTTVAGTNQLAGAEVPTAPLAELLRPEEVARLRVIKVDVEGAEAEVVEGLLPLLDRTRPDVELFVEIDSERLARQGVRADDIVDALAEHGFHPYRLRNDYDAWRYVGRQPPSPPTRFEGPLEGEVDLVFSRIDALSL